MTTEPIDQRFAVRVKNEFGEEVTADRRYLAFAQAEGAAPLPRQLRLKEVSDEMRVRLGNYIDKIIEHSAERTSDGIYHVTCIESGLADVLRDYFSNYLRQPARKFEDDPSHWREKLGETFESGSYIDIFGFLECVIRHRKYYPLFRYKINDILVETRSAYRIALEERTIYPIASEEEAQVVARAFEDVSQHGYGIAREHLRKSSEFLTAGDWADSVRESVNAVESVLKVIEPKATTLGDALKRLEKSGGLHPSLKKGMDGLWGYASDVARHAKGAEPAEVDEHEAMYVFGACATLISFLINKFPVNQSG